jgi:peptidoglycan-associated lipoprotein
MLKHSILFLSLFFITQFSFAQNESDGSTKSGVPVMKFDKRLHDFGVVKKGEIKTTYFEFTNEGDVALEIELISACDCTTTDYPRLPVKPGEKGKIKVVFDSTEKEESETIDIDIFLRNTDPKTGIPIIEMLQYSFELKN